jgi:hypothetical protein
MKSKKNIEPKESRDKIALDIVREITKYSDELIANPLAETNLLQIRDHLRILINHQHEFESGTSYPNKFMTLGQIEEVILSLQRFLEDADLKALLEKMSNLPGENDIVAQKKTNSSKKA